MSLIEQSCPECGSTDIVPTKFDGLLQCLDCDEYIEDDQEVVDWEIESRQRKNKRVTLEED